MVVNEYRRKCMKLCDGIGLYTMSYGCICTQMDVCESIWWYRNVNGTKWEYMKVYEAIYGIWMHMKA